MVVAVLLDLSCSTIVSAKSTAEGCLVIELP